MRRYRGPCKRCGTIIDRKFRTGREALCIDCALEKAAHQARIAHLPDAPGVANRDRHNAEFAAQVEARKGPIYEKWRAGLERALEDHPSTNAG